MSSPGDSFYASHPQGISLRLKVTPKAAHNKIKGIFQDADGLRLKIFVTAVPEDGKANLAVIDLLSQKLRLPKSAFSLISGQTTSRKTILIEGDGDALQTLLHALLLEDKTKGP